MDRIQHMNTRTTASRAHPAHYDLARAIRRDAFASQVPRNAAGGLGKPPFGSRIPASRQEKVRWRCPMAPLGIVEGFRRTEKPGYAIIWVSYVGFYPLEQFPIILNHADGANLAGR